MTPVQQLLASGSEANIRLALELAKTDPDAQREIGDALAFFRDNRALWGTLAPSGDLETWEELQFLSAAESIHLRAESLTEAARWMRNMCYLRVKISDTNVLIPNTLRQMKKLKNIALFATQADLQPRVHFGQDLAQWRDFLHLSLHQIDLAEAPSGLERLRKLRYLTLDGVHLRESAHLIWEALPTLNGLHLNGSTRLDRAPNFAALPYLETLSISDHAREHAEARGYWEEIMAWAAPPERNLYLLD